MTQFQMIAHSSPCFHASATINRKFSHVEDHGRYSISIMLTANIGLE